MSITKNVQYLKIEKDMLEEICEFLYQERLSKIQDIYRELRNRINRITNRWMKVDGEDCYLFMEEDFKILIPDTRKLRPVIWIFGVESSFQGALEAMKYYSQQDMESYKTFAQMRKADIVTDFAKKIAGIPAKGITFEVTCIIFERNDCPWTDHNGYILLADGAKTGFVITDERKNVLFNAVDNTIVTSGNDYLGVQLSVHEFKESETLFDIAEQYGIIPDFLNTEEKALIKEISHLYKDGVKTEDMDSLKSYLLNSNRKELFGYTLDYDKIKEDILNREIDMTDDSQISAAITQYLNEYDYHRAKIQKYSPRWYLSDEGKGHWDLWHMSKSEDDKDGNEGTEKTTEEYMLHIKGGIIARDPGSDIKYNAVVGIDFGTKSTIVAVLDDNDNIIPLRVGMADYLEEPRRKHYENPTVMQFIDLNTFYQIYQSREGRPYTSWEDLKISHEAFENMITAKQSKEHAAFLYNLKQWAGGRYGKRDAGHLVIRDQKGDRYDINDYESLTNEDIDPIELYAYYLGIFINNMHTGIYLDYLLSFPETFSLEIRGRLLSSFRKGIKRSLPACIFDNEEVQAAFRVRQGPSEPAAYAACALEQYGVEPDDKGVFYGIFDFGGGTTDFDYGIWKNGPEDEDSYDYVIRHFCAGGDKSLGGENLLELLAYHVFSDDETQFTEESSTNFQLIREKKIVFYRPPEGKIIPGTEALISTEESAVLNTKQLMEILRPIWEEQEAWLEWKKNSGNSRTKTVIKCGNNGELILLPNSVIIANVSLFDEAGDNKVDVQLAIDEELVEQTLKCRIEQGVRNFFEALQSAYMKNEIESNEPIHIFLAGNSSSSTRVTELFEQYIEMYEELMFGKKATEIEEDDTMIVEEGIVEEEETSHFILFPPLGSSSAVEIQEERGIDLEKDDLMAPTGKTGVAFGLLMCRENSGIKVESEQKKTEQIRLGYYIGMSKCKCFKLVFDRNTEYNQWHVFRKALDEMETFEFYYTELPEVISGDKEIKNNPSIHRRKCLVDKSKEGAFIFFRFITPTSLEYVVADKEGIENGEYISSIYRVSL